MRMEFNKENWSGESVKINVNLQTREFSLYGYRFRLVLMKKTVVDQWEWRTYDIMGDGWEYPLGVVVQHDDLDKETQDIEAFHGEISEGNISRNGSNIYEAAAKMLCMVV